MFLAICWGLWQGRNEMIRNSKSPEVRVILSRSLSLFNAWVEARNLLKMNQEPNIRQPDKVKWKKSPTYWIKLNANAVKFESECPISGMLRIDRGLFVVGHVKKLNQHHTPEVLEALA